MVCSNCTGTGSFISFSLADAELLFSFFLVYLYASRSDIFRDGVGYRLYHFRNRLLLYKSPSWLHYLNIFTLLHDTLLLAIRSCCMSRRYCMDCY